MSARPFRVLCVGSDVGHLKTRCDVLVSVGYIARSVTVSGAETLLQTDEFDLVIVSAWLEEWERSRILAAAGKTPTLVLTQLTFADDLLVQVEQMLGR
jgi:hypothetical protein